MCPGGPRCKLLDSPGSYVSGLLCNNVLRVLIRVADVWGALLGEGVYECVCECRAVFLCSLEVTLEKKEQDLTWTSLFDDGRGYPHKPHSTELQDVLQKKLDALKPEKNEVRAVCCIVFFV